MADSNIEWTDKVWNPVVGCNKVSKGCKHCYAEVMHRRLMKMNPEKYNRPFLDGAFPHEPSLNIPLKWKKPKRIFVNSMSDLFHVNIQFEFIDRVFRIMQLAPKHTYQVLTKRADRMAQYFQHRKKMFEDTGCDPFYSLSMPNVWLGTSIEDQEQLNLRMPELLRILEIFPKANLWLSVEPMLGEIDLSKYLYKIITDFQPKYASINSQNGQITLAGTKKSEPAIGWVVCGGESGKGARPTHPDWVRRIRDDCKSASIPFLFKQWGVIVRGDQIPEDVAYNMMDKETERELDLDGFYKVGKKKAGRLLDGVLYDEYPKGVRNNAE